MNLFSPLLIIILFSTFPLKVYSSELFILLKTNNCTDCDLSFSDLNYSIFKDGDLSRSNLSFSNASRSSFFNYSFKSANLSRANFSHARLISSDFTDVIFDNTVFYKTVVTDSIFDFKTVPSEIIINSLDFPIHLLPKSRLAELLSSVSPDDHPSFYLSILNYLQKESPDNPSISLFFARFYYKYQLDYSLMISSLENASSQYLALNQPDKSLEINKIIKLVRARSEDQASLKMPGTQGNGLGITAMDGIKNLFGNLLPTLTTLANLIH